MEIKSFIVAPEDAGLRIDSYLETKIENMSRNHLQGLLQQQKVQVDSTPVKKNYKIKDGQKITVVLEPAKELENIEAQNIPLHIVYEDTDLLVVNKPKGMVVHPAAGNEAGTMVNALLYHCKGNLSGINGTIRPGIVHRIDKNTSGLLVVAKNDLSHQFLAKQIQEHSFTRAYKAVVYGNLKQNSGCVNAPIGRNPKNRKQMAIVTQGGREAITHYEILESFRGFDYLQLQLETGRTHQIRVHMASIGHPLAGDDVYGPKKVIQSLQGQCLHAYKLGFVHPTTLKYMEFSAPLPKVFEKFLEKLRKQSF